MLGTPGENSSTSSIPRPLAAKIKRDATKTTGAAWKSVDAGPNRIDRWVMLLPDADLKAKFKIDLPAMKPAVQAKLRDKAAKYEDCMDVAAKLTWAAYQMKNAPTAPAELNAYLAGRFGKMDASSTRCIVCRDILDFKMFEGAQRGSALIERHADIEPVHYVIRHYLREAPDPAPLCEATVFYPLAEHRSAVQQPYQTPEGRRRAVTPRRAGHEKSS
jgi:hypothetical protein